ncbi:MAG: SH3 domain-containing protein, partial [Mogibacterium sp.]|nr:SH3 domain-containing protein [Mogibacterium sp.]
VDGIHYTVKSSAASDEVNTRTGPESGFAQTGQYPKGAPVKVVMKSKYKDNQHYWYKVYEGGKYYYAFASYVKVGGSSKSGIKFLTKAELDSLAAAKKAAEAKKYALPKVNSTQQKRAQAFLNECDKLGKLIVKNKFIYSNSGVQRNYAAAVKCTVKKTNCALYVSWALQNYGILPKDKTIWLNNRINGNGTDYIKASKKVAICYPNRKTKDLDLLPGDICGFQVTPLSKHTMVYAGKDAKGRRLWYSAGPTTVPTNLCKVLGTVYDDKEVKVLIRIL